MTRRTRVRFINLTKRAEEKLAERSAILYARALDRWTIKEPPAKRLG